MAKHERFPLVLSSFSCFRHEDLHDAANSVAFKLGGSQYGPMLAEVLPMLDKLAKAGRVPSAKGLYFGEKKPEKIGDVGMLAYVLIGRSEHSHARGKKLFTSLAGSDGDKTSETIVKERSDEAVRRIKAAYTALNAAPATKPAFEQKEGKVRKAK